MFLSDPFHLLQGLLQLLCSFPLLLLLCCPVSLICLLHVPYLHLLQTFQGLSFLSPLFSPPSPFLCLPWLFHQKVYDLLYCQSYSLQGSPSCHFSLFLIYWKVSPLLSLFLLLRIFLRFCCLFPLLLPQFSGNSQVFHHHLSVFLH